jgi:uncharacterized protein (DUF302 family)
MENGVVHLKSWHSVAGTLSRLETILQRKALTLLARIDHSDEAAKVGLTLRPTHLMIFGNAHSGTPLMSASPGIAIDLPLKALVWQDDEGAVWLSYNTPAYLEHRHDIPHALITNIAGVVAICEEAVRPETAAS